MATRASKRVKVTDERDVKSEISDLKLIKVEKPIKQEKSVKKEPSIIEEPENEEGEEDAADNDLGISHYEKVRIENIRRNEEFLSTLGLEAHRTSVAVSKPAQASRRGTDSGKSRPPAAPTRRSGRMTVEKLKNEVLELEGDEKAVKQQLLDEMLTKQKAGAYEIDVEPASSWSSWDAQERIVEPELSLFPASNQPADTEVKNWVRPMIEAFGEDDVKETASTVASKGKGKAIKKEMKSENIVKSEYSVTTADEYTKRMSRLSVAEDEVAKVTESRITSVWIHPTTDKVLIGAGDKGGNLGIWDVKSSSTGNGGVFKFKPHVGGITKLHAYANASSKVYSVSADGTIRFLDLGKEAFVLGFTAPEGLYDISFNDASFASDGNTVFVGKTDGKVGLVDFRSKSANSYQWCFETQPTKVNSVQQHPTDDNLIITAGSNAAGAICIHDIRKAGAKWTALKTLNEHTKSVNAAYCSPNGEYLVSVGQDSTIRTWKNFINPSEDAIWTATRHDNHTGRYILIECFAYLTCLCVRTVRARFSILPLDSQQLSHYALNFNRNQTIFSLL